MNQTQVTHSHIPPVKGLHQMLRSSGYDFEDCILEFIDNSKDAKAKEVEILLYPNTTDENLERLAILDYDGKGMNMQELMEGITIAHTRIHTLSEIGFYGFGLNSASLNIGNELLVLSKPASANTFIGARIDFAAQERSNNYSPTRVSSNAREDLFEYIPDDLVEMLADFENTSESVTLIQVSRPHIHLASMNCKALRDRIMNRLRVAYTDNENFCMSVRIANGNLEEPIEISPQDMFYHNQLEKLRKPLVKVNLYALIPQRETDPIHVYEMNTSKRPILRNKKLTETSGTQNHAVWYNLSSENMTATTDPFAHPNGMPVNIKEIIPFTMELAFVKQETFNEEPEDRRSKGIWFQRGPRVVAQSLTLGIHGINAHGHLNQMRAIVKYPPSLDRHIGSRYNKALNPKSGPLKDAIIRVWKDQTSAWVKMKEDERRQPNTVIAVMRTLADSSNSPTEEAEQREEVESRDSLAEEETQPAVVEQEERQTRLNVQVTPPENQKSVIIKDNKVILVQGEEEVAEVDGLKQNSCLRPYIERCLKLKGFQKTARMMKAMQEILTEQD